MNKQIPSSTGGVITFTATGLRHSAGSNYSSAHAPADIVAPTKPVRALKGSQK